jgi:hypothetical protein
MSLRIENGHGIVVPVALVAAIVATLIVIITDDLTRLEIECEKNPAKTWDIETRKCVPRAHRPHTGPTPPLDTPNPIRYPNTPRKDVTNGSQP